MGERKVVGVKVQVEIEYKRSKGPLLLLLP